MRFFLAPIALVLDLYLLAAFAGALPWLLHAAFWLLAIALVGWIIFVAVRAALRLSL